jgi:hypothetical protein
MPQNQPLYATQDGGETVYRDPDGGAETTAANHVADLALRMSVSEFREVIGVTCGYPVRVAAFIAALGGIGPHRLEHPESRRPGAGSNVGTRLRHSDLADGNAVHLSSVRRDRDRLDQRFVEEECVEIENVVPRHRATVTDGFSREQASSAREDGESLEQDAFRVLEQLVTPIERGGVPG